MADGDFELHDYADTVNVYAGDADAPVELTGEHAISLSHLPFELHVESLSGQGCAIVIPLATDGDEVTLLSPTGTLDLELLPDGITFIAPASGDLARIPGQFLIGDDITLRPLMAAPELPVPCRHGISPASACPINPP